MIAPAIAARMKQGRNMTRIRINPGEVCAFVQVALKTGQRKIFKVVRSSMLAGDDVLDVKGMKTVVFLAEAAILAAMASAPADLVADDFSHHEAV